MLLGTGGQVSVGPEWIERYFNPIRRWNAAGFALGCGAVAAHSMLHYEATLFKASADLGRDLWDWRNDLFTYPSSPRHLGKGAYERTTKKGQYFASLRRTRSGCCGRGKRDASPAPPSSRSPRGGRRFSADTAHVPPPMELNAAANPDGAAGGGSSTEPLARRTSSSCIRRSRDGQMGCTEAGVDAQSAVSGKSPVSGESRCTEDAPQGHAPY